MTHFSKCCKILFSGILEETLDRCDTPRIKRMKRILENFDQYFVDKHKQAISDYIFYRSCGLKTKTIFTHSHIKKIKPLIRALRELTGGGDLIDQKKQMAIISAYIPDYRLDRQDYRIIAGELS